MPKDAITVSIDDAFEKIVDAADRYEHGCRGLQSLRGAAYDAKYTKAFGDFTIDVLNILSDLVESTKNK